MTSNLEVLRSIGVEDSVAKSRKPGFVIEDMDGYFRREQVENRLMEGLDVLDDDLPVQRSQIEKDNYRRVKDLERLELERCNEDKSNTMQWTDYDEKEWQAYLADQGYGQGSGVTGSIDIARTMTQSEAKKKHNNRWQAGRHKSR